MQLELFPTLAEYEPIDRITAYSKPHCWQYDIRLRNREIDLVASGLTEKEVSSITVDDLEFGTVAAAEKKECREIAQFINRHEWLGKMPMAVTHRFVAKYKGVLAGVVVMATPNAFSNLLGAGTRDLEKLIARGACISWAPDNTASWLIMKSINYMVSHTDFRVFTGYSDPDARELGTIYQACNFHYLGQHFGGVRQFFDPLDEKRGWFGENGFNDRSQIVRYARQLGIPWEDEWYRRVGVNNRYRKINWSAIPPDIVQQLKDERIAHKKMCRSRTTAKKHKYAYVKGIDKRETRKLMKMFYENNPKLPYPKERGK
jgi:hypothetical protein